MQKHNFHEKKLDINHKKFLLLLLIPMAIQCMEDETRNQLLLTDWNRVKKIYINELKQRHENLNIDVQFENSHPFIEAKIKIPDWGMCIASCSLLCSICSFGLSLIGTFVLAERFESSESFRISIYGLLGFTFCIGVPSTMELIRRRLPINRIIEKERRHLSQMRHFHLRFLSNIKEQNVETISTFLRVTNSLPLDVAIDQNGDTPLLVAIKYADLKKDPEALIIKALICRGASLWYENPNVEDDGSVSPEKLEEGTRTIPPHKQPMLMLANRKDLYEAVLKPLCAMAQKKLTAKRKTPLSPDEKIIKILLMDSKKESGKDEE